MNLFAGDDDDDDAGRDITIHIKQNVALMRKRKDELVLGKKKKKIGCERKICAIFVLTSENL